VEFAVEGRLEHVALEAGGPEFELGVGGCREKDGDGAFAGDGAEGGDVAVVAAVEGVGDAKEAGEFPHEVARGGVEGDVIGVGFFRQGFAVIAGDVGEDVELVQGEAVEIAVLDEIERMLVVAGVADVPADVVEDGGVFEELAFLGAELVERLELVEEREGELGDLQGMLFVEIAAAAELEDRAAAGVADLHGEFHLGPVGLHVVDDHAFAEGAVADVDFADVEFVKEVGDEHGAGDDLIGAAGVEPGEMPAFGEGRAEQAFADGLEIIAGHLGEEAVADGFFAVLMDAHGGEVLHGAGGADDALDVVGADGFDGGLEGFAEVFFEVFEVSAVEGVGGDELLGEA